MRYLLVFLVGGIFGAVGGGALMLILFPFIFPPPMVNEQVDTGGGAELVHETSFRENVPGQDLAHWGRGDIRVYLNPDGGYLVELQSNFEVGPGPNFWLYSNTSGDIDDEDDFRADMGRVRLTKLKSFQGSQVYEVERGHLRDAGALTIWCESFHQYIASANITVGG